MVIAGTLENLKTTKKNHLKRQRAGAVQLSAERTNSTSATEVARKNCYSAASRRMEAMLQLGEGAENRPSAEKHKILRLLGIYYFHIHCPVFKFLFSMLNIWVQGRGWLKQ